MFLSLPILNNAKTVSSFLCNKIWYLEYYFLLRWSWRILVLLDLGKMLVRGSLINAASNHINDHFEPLLSSEISKKASKIAIFGFYNLIVSISPSRISFSYNDMDWKPVDQLELKEILKGIQPIAFPEIPDQISRKRSKIWFLIANRGRFFLFPKQPAQKSINFQNLHGTAHLMKSRLHFGYLLNCNEFNL